MVISAVPLAWLVVATPSQLRLLDETCTISGFIPLELALPPPLTVTACAAGFESLDELKLKEVGDTETLAEPKPPETWAETVLVG